MHRKRVNVINASMAKGVPSSPLQMQLHKDTYRASNRRAGLVVGFTIEYGVRSTRSAWMPLKYVTKDSSTENGILRILYAFLKRDHIGNRRFAGNEPTWVQKLAHLCARECTATMPAGFRLASEVICRNQVDELVCFDPESAHGRIVSGMKSLLASLSPLETSVLRMVNDCEVTIKARVSSTHFGGLRARKLLPESFKASAGGSRIDVPPLNETPVLPFLHPTYNEGFPI